MPPSADLLGFPEEMEDAARALDFILEPRPGDYTNLIRRYSNYTGVVQPARPKTAIPDFHCPSPAKTFSFSSNDSSRTPGRAWTTRGIAKAVDAVRGAKKSEMSSTCYSTPSRSREMDEEAAEKVRQLEDENASLRERLAALEAVLSADADGLDSADNLGRLRARMLKARNMQLEQEVVALAGSVSGATVAKQEVLAALKDLKQKARELQQMPPLVEPRPPLPSTLMRPSSPAPSAKSQGRLSRPPAGTSPSGGLKPIRTSSPVLTSSMPSVSPHQRPMTPMPSAGKTPGAPARSAMGRRPSTAGPAGSRMTRECQTDTEGPTYSRHRRGSTAAVAGRRVSAASPASSLASSPVVKGTSSFGSSPRISLFGSSDSSVRKSNESSAGSSTPRFSRQQQLDGKSPSIPARSELLHHEGDALQEGMWDAASVYSTDDRAAQLQASAALKAEALSAMAHGTPPVYHGPPRVAVQRDWLGELERLCAALEGRLRRAGAAPPRWLDSDALGSDPQAATGTPLQATFLSGGLNGEVAVPFLAAAGNRFVVKGVEGEAVAGLSDNIARVLHGTLPLVQYGQVHQLEGRLGALHPQLLTLHNLLKSLVFPSLPAEASEAMMQDFHTALEDVHYAARALSELAALVPAGVQLRGFGPEVAAEELSESEWKNGQGRGPVEGPLGDADVEAPSVMSQFPSADEIMRALPRSLEDLDGEAAARRVLQCVVDKLRNTEARWQAEMRAAQHELAFYRGCHAAQAWHVKQVVSAGQFVLEALLGDAYIIGASAMDSVNRILGMLQEPDSFQTVHMWREAVAQEAPTLQQLAKVFPQNFSAPKAAQDFLDPLEREFKSRMQVVFEKLQSRRASLARGQSPGAPPNPSPAVPSSPRATPTVPSSPSARNMPAVPSSPSARGMPTVPGSPTVRGLQIVPSSPSARGMPSPFMPVVPSSPSARGMPSPFMPVVPSSPSARGMPSPFMPVVPSSPSARGMPSPFMPGTPTAASVSGRLSGSPVGRITGNIVRSQSPSGEDRRMLRPLSFGSPQRARPIATQ